MCCTNNTPERTVVQINASCSAEEISHLLSVAIKDKNLQLAKQLLDSLACLSRSDLIVQALVETINNETIEYNSDIYTIVIGAIANYTHLPGLRDVWENIYSCKTPPITVEELLKGTEFAECECFASQHGKVEHDERLDRFLNGFKKFGTAIIELGYCYNSGVGDYRGVAIHEGRISHEDSEIILSFLDAVGINEDLPEFQGRWRENYRFEDSKWRSVAQTKGDETKWLWIECLACTNT